MASSPALTNFDNTTPAAPTGKMNVVWQGGSPSTETITFQGQTITVSARNVSAYVPNLGGVDKRTTTTETIGLASQGKLVLLTTASPIAVTLDSTVPNNFMCFVSCEVYGLATLTPSSGTIDGAADIVLASLQGVALYFDGTNWWTDRGLSAALSNPMTTEGDLIVGGASGVPVRLAAGTSGQVLQTNGTGSLPSWVAGGGGGGAPTTDSYVLGQRDLSNLPNAVFNPTAAYGLDVAPATAGSLDDEFDGSSLNLTRWTWIGQSTGPSQANVAKSLLQLIDTAANNNSGGGSIVQACPSTPWAVTAKCQAAPGLYSGPTPYHFAGVILANGNTGAAKWLQFGASSQPGSLLIAIFAINGGAYVSTPYSSNFTWWAVGSTPFFWLRVGDDGTNVNFSVSYDGVNFFALYSQGRTSFLTGGPTYVGLCSQSNNTSHNSMQLLVDWFRRTT
jgi:hypothetical protein